MVPSGLWSDGKIEKILADCASGSAAPVGFCLVEQEQISELLTESFNPPHFGNGYTREDFEQEWQTAYQSFEKVLRSFAEREGWTEDEDYSSYNERLSDERGLTITLYTEKTLSSRIVKLIQLMLSVFPEDYEVMLEYDRIGRPEYAVALIRRSTVHCSTSQAHLRRHFRW